MANGTTVSFCCTEKIKTDLTDINLIEIIINKLLAYLINLAEILSIICLQHHKHTNKSMQLLHRVIVTKSDGRRERKRELMFQHPTQCISTLNQDVQ